MVAAQVIGHDASITLAGQSGNFQLNVMLPLIAYDLLESIRLLAERVAPARRSRDRGLHRQSRAARRSARAQPDPGDGAQSRSSATRRAQRSPSAPMPRASRSARWRQRMSGLPREQLERLLDPTELTRGGIKVERRRRLAPADDRPLAPRPGCESVLAAD